MKKEYWIHNGEKHPDSLAWYANTWKLWGIALGGTDTGKPYTTLKSALKRAKNMNYRLAMKGRHWTDPVNEIPEVFWVVEFEAGKPTKIEEKQ